MAQADTILFGRVTYQMFESVWPKIAVDPNAPKEARIIAHEVNQMTKVVFSQTLTEVPWENSKLFKGSLAEEVRKFKQANGPDIIIFGSGVVCRNTGSSAHLVKDELVWEEG